jgi:hypothetical protein
MVHALTRKYAYRADGARRTEEELLAELGPIGGRLVLLQDAADRLVSCIIRPSCSWPTNGTTRIKTRGCAALRRRDLANRIHHITRDWAVIG